MCKTPNWNTCKLSTKCNLLGGYGFPDKFQGDFSSEVPFVKVSDMNLSGNEKFITRSNNYVSSHLAEKMGWKPFSVNSIVFAKVGAALKLNRRRILSIRTLIDNNMMAAEPLPELNSSFLYHFLSIVDFGNFVQDGALPSINQSQVGCIEIPDIPINVQRAIATILDSVDEAIRHAEALIAKLRQVKAGMLHDLLTYGLDENGELRDPIRHPEQFKDSPLGRIPKEWEPLPLEKIAQVSSGVTLGNTPQGAGTIELPYLRVANVQDGYLDLSDIKKVQIYKKDIDRFALREGDVLMNEGGDYDKLGRGAVWESQIEPCLHQNHVFRVRAFPGLLNSYFLDAVSGSQYGKSYFLLSSKQSTNLASINSTQLNKFPIPCPKIDEQVAIVSILSEHHRTIKQEMVGLDKLISLKQGLMHDLLTGTVRVPASLPEAIS